MNTNENIENNNKTVKVTNIYLTHHLLGIFLSNLHVVTDGIVADTSKIGTLYYSHFLVDEVFERHCQCLSKKMVAI